MLFFQPYVLDISDVRLATSSRHLRTSRQRYAGTSACVQADNATQVPAHILLHQPHISCQKPCVHSPHWCVTFYASQYYFHRIVQPAMEDRHRAILYGQYPPRLFDRKYRFHRVVDTAVVHCTIPISSRLPKLYIALPMITSCPLPTK